MPRTMFGTLINCIDGRVQLPVIAWMREVLSLEYVDLVTQPGADSVLANQPELANQLIRPAVGLSIVRHASPVLAVAGHHDCLANPVSVDVHRQHLMRSVRTLLGWDLGVKVLALWVNEQWQVEVVQTRSGQS